MDNKDPRCPGCGVKAISFHSHHIVPRSLGGLDSPSNIIDICEKCHGKIHDKGNMNISELTKAALQHKKSNGQRVGNIPFGFRVAADGIAIVKDDSEQMVLGTLIELRQRGFTLRAVAAELNRLGLKTRRGTDWKHQYIASLCRLQLNEVVFVHLGNPA